MSDLKDLLDRKAGRFAPHPSGWDRMQRLADRRQRHRRLGAAIVAVTIFVGVGAALWLALRSVGPALRPTPGSTASNHVAGTALHVTNLRMVTPTAGWAMSTDPGSGRRRVLVTRDGGTTWADVTPSGIGGDESGLSASFLDSSHAWLVWPRGRSSGPTDVTVFATGDGGRSWRNSRFIAPLGGPGQVQFVDPLHGWAIGNIVAALGHDPVEVWRTVDGGATWRSVSVSRDPYVPNLPAPTAHALPPCSVQASFVDTAVGYAISLCNSGAELYTSHDAGQTWFPVSVSPPFPQNGGPGAPAFTSMADGFIPVLAPQGQGATGVYVSHDGGRSWTLASLPLQAIDAGPTFADAQHGWFFGRRKLLYATVDGGVHWSSFRPNLTLAGSTLQFIDPLHGWAFYPSGEHPWLLRTDDGGHRWEQLTPQLRR